MLLRSSNYYQHHFPQVKNFVWVVTWRLESSQIVIQTHQGNICDAEYDSQENRISEDGGDKNLECC